MGNCWPKKQPIISSPALKRKEYVRCYANSVFGEALITLNVRNINERFDKYLPIHWLENNHVIWCEKFVEPSSNTLTVLLKFNSVYYIIGGCSYKVDTDSIYYSSNNPNYKISTLSSSRLSTEYEAKEIIEIIEHIKKAHCEQQECNVLVYYVSNCMKSTFRVLDIERLFDSKIFPLFVEPRAADEPGETN